MDESEEVAFISVFHLEEVTVCGAVEDHFRVGNIPAVGKLDTGNGKGTFRGAFGEEQNDDVLSLHDSFGNGHDFCKTFFILYRVEGLHAVKIFLVHHEFCVLFVSGLISVAVPVNGLLGIGHREFFTLFKGLLADIQVVFLAVVANVHGGRFTVFGKRAEKLHDLFVFQGGEF